MALARTRRLGLGGFSFDESLLNYTPQAISTLAFADQVALATRLMAALDAFYIADTAGSVTVGDASTAQHLTDTLGGLDPEAVAQARDNAVPKSANVFSDVDPYAVAPAISAGQIQAGVSAFVSSHPALRPAPPNPIGQGAGNPGEIPVYTYANEGLLSADVLNRVPLGTSLRGLITAGAYSQESIDTLFGNTSALSLSNPFYATDATAYGWGSVLNGGAIVPSSSSLAIPSPSLPPLEFQNGHYQLPDGTVTDSTGTPLPPAVQQSTALSVANPDSTGGLVPGPATGDPLADPASDPTAVGAVTASASSLVESPIVWGLIALAAFAFTQKKRS